MRVLKLVCGSLTEHLSGSRVLAPRGSGVGTWLFPLLLLLLFPSLGCSEEIVSEAVVRPVKIMKLGEAGAFGARIFPGTVRAGKRARLAFRVSGPLIERPVFEGLAVKKGAVLAKIDPRDFRTAVMDYEAQLAQLKAELESMQRARPEDIRSLEANLSASRSRLVEASATFRRYRSLYENDNVSKAEFDQRRASRDVAKAELARAQESLNVAQRGARVEDIDAMRARIRSMEAMVDQANDRLNDTALLAPYDGVVAELFVENNEHVQAQQEIVSFQNIDTVEVVAQIPESVVAQADRSREMVPEFKVRFESLPNLEFSAEATEISTEADPVTRTFSVVFVTKQPEEGNVFAGMTADVSLKERTLGDDVFMVPVSAVFGDETGAKSVWVLDESTMQPEKRDVELGEMSGESVVVTDGLNPGETIIIAGAHAVREGKEVRPVTDELRERR